MTMTKKDYALIAEAIAQVKVTSMEEQGTKDDIILSLSIALENQNPRFESVKFERVCGYTFARENQ
jgi:hypothetical protein